MPVSERQRAWAASPSGHEALGNAKADAWTHTSNAEIASERKRRGLPARAGAVKRSAKRLGR